jgi:peptidoglycan/xylan/chitin deacetylase (PgdA/CDA1 family)
METVYKLGDPSQQLRTPLPDARRTLCSEWQGEIMGRIQAFVVLALLGMSAGLLASDSPRLSVPASVESHRVSIQNRAGGEIRGSRDQGRTWVKLGTVTTPIRGGLWYPTRTAGVLAFHFLRGPSQVFGSAVNAIHVRVSDPEGYTLPSDPTLPLNDPEAFSIMPRGSSSSSGIDQSGPAVAVTDMAPGTGLFSALWSPKVGSQVLVAAPGQPPVPVAAGTSPPLDSEILIVVDRAVREIETIEIENVVGGRVLLKREGEAPFQVAKVKKPVSGVGRFQGSEYVRRVGSVRANHAGVLCIGTSDAGTPVNGVMPTLPANATDLRGGFQIVPSFHFEDRSMKSGNGHPEVYLVVGPVQDPPSIPRYDFGIEGSWPLFLQGLRAGMGSTELRFRGESTWIELSQAIAQGRIRGSKGEVLKSLRGKQLTSLSAVEGIRIHAADITRRPHATPLVMMYHEVVAKPEDLGATADTTVDGLRAQLEYLIRDQGYTPVSIDQLDRSLNGPEPRPVLPEKSFVVTFDDGYASALTRAAPVLRELKVPAAFFINTEFMGGSSEPLPGKKRLFLTWDQVRELDADPLFTVQAHGLGHPRLTNLSPEKIEEQLAGAQAKLREVLGGDRAWYAYPYGAFDDRVLAFSVFDRSKAFDPRFNIERYPVRSKDLGGGRFLPLDQRAEIDRQIQAWLEHRYSYSMW